MSIIHTTNQVISIANIMKHRLVEPVNWVIFNNQNHVYFICTGVIHEEDRDIIQHYFPNAYIDYGLRLKNPIHLFSKGLRFKCSNCTKTFSIDKREQYRKHFIKKHLHHNPIKTSISNS